MHGLLSSQVGFECTHSNTRHKKHDIMPLVEEVLRSFDLVLNYLSLMKHFVTLLCE